MYQEIAQNKRQTWLLIAIFTGLLAAVGYVYGYVSDTGSSGLAFALVISIGMTLFSWFAGDKVILFATGAKEIVNREQNRYVWNLVENLAITAGLPRPRIYLVDDPSPNAFATGRDPEHASVTLTTGIVQLLENEELEGVIAHELSHIKNFDIRYLMLVSVMVGALSMLGDFFIRGSMFRGRRDRRSRDGGFLILLGVIFIVLAPIIGQLIKFAISRRREFLADASGALLTRYPEGLARALEKISAHAQPMAGASQATAHLWIADPFAKPRLSTRISGLFATHPPIAERVAALRKMA